MKEIACIFNFGSHYRKSIYQLMDKELKCDFYFGDKLRGSIKSMDNTSLNGCKENLKNIYLWKNFYWQKGSISILLKPYSHLIIDGEPYCLSSWFILIFSKILGKKVYPWTHGWYGRETFIKIILKKCFFGLAHHIFLYGDYAKDLMIKEGFSKDKLSCIYNSLDYEEQLNLRNQQSLSDIYSKYFNNDNLNLFFVGRLTNEKKLDLLLNAVCVLKKKSINFNVTLIGDGEAKEKLEKLAKELNIEDNVWFYGACYDESKLSNLIFNADICVSPGNVGLTAIHSMSFGTPVITHNNFPYQGPEFEAIQDGLTGTYFKQDDADSLVDAISRWLSQGFNRKLIRQNCYKIIDERYNPYFQINHFRQFFFHK